jgi:hypothetical protein
MSRITRRETMTALIAAQLPLSGHPIRNAGVAFHYQSHFAPRQLEWYTRFEILVTGCILSAQQTAALKRGPKLVAYEWSSGYYLGDAVSAPLEWQRKVESQGQRWLLTSRPMTGASAENGRLAQWYDFGSDELINQRAAYLADRMVRAGYEGYFFDTVGDQCLPPEVQAAFQQRHPGMNYNQRQGLFLKALRSLLPSGKLIFLNQGYRHAEHLLPHADLDLSESYFTFVNNGGTGFRPWHDPARPWESVKTPMENLIAPVLRKFPRVRMVHANYASGPTRDVSRARRYSFACARLFGQEAYTIVPGAPLAEEDDLYGSALGRAIGPYVEDPGQSVAWREFERGVVAVNGSSRPARIGPLGLALPDPLQGYVFRRGS